MGTSGRSIVMTSVVLVAVGWWAYRAANSELFAGFRAPPPPILRVAVDSDLEALDAQVSGSAADPIESGLRWDVRVAHAAEDRIDLEVSKTRGRFVQLVELGLTFRSPLATPSVNLRARSYDKLGTASWSFSDLDGWVSVSATALPCDVAPDDERTVIVVAYQVNGICADSPAMVSGKIAVRAKDLATKPGKPPAKPSAESAMPEPRGQKGPELDLTPVSKWPLANRAQDR